MAKRIFKFQTRGDECIDELLGNREIGSARNGACFVCICA